MSMNPQWPFPSMTPLLRLALAACLVFGTLAVPTVAQPADDPPEQDSAKSATTSKVDGKIDDILTRLQKRSDGLKDIRCRVKFVEVDRVNLTERVKLGRIRFMITDPNPLFMIHFDRTEVDGLLGKQEWYLFDGRWFYQVLERVKRITKQEIARPGERKDMFDLEKAPFPLPFGQKKESILQNFDVTLVPWVAGDPPQSDHLVCIPKPGSALKDRYDKLDFYVLRTVDLPGRIVVTKNDGYEINRADFPDLSSKSINTALDAKDFSKPGAWRGYEQVVEELPPLQGNAP